MNPSTNNSRCSLCQEGWVPLSAAQGCQQCPDMNGSSIAFLIIIFFVGIFLFVILIVLKMKSSGRRKATHSTLKRTILTHIQMVSIIMSLKVSWPETVRTIMVGLGSIMTVSGKRAIVAHLELFFHWNSFSFSFFVMSFFVVFFLI